MLALSNRHFELLRLLALGMSREQVASHLGLSVATVSTVANSPAGRVYMEQLQNSREEHLNQMVAYARAHLPGVIKTASDLMDDVAQDPSTRLMAAKVLINLSCVPKEIRVVKQKKLSVEFRKTLDEAASAELVTEFEVENKV